MGHAIFISYRRDDTEGEAGRLFDDLTRTFGEDCVFMDVSGISPGVDFRKAIDDNVTSCGVLLAMIGPNWVSIANPDGKRRLDDPSDFVALEIASALKRNVPVIPVLVHDARMPHPEQLPDSLKDLAYRNSVELTHERWNSDTTLLIGALNAYVTPMAKAEEKEPVHATVPVQLPPPHPESTPSKPPQKSNAGLITGIVVAALAIAVALFLFLRPGTKPQPIPASPASDSAASPPATAVPAASTPAAGAPATPAQPPQATSPATPSAPITALQGKWADPKKRGGESLNTLEIIGIENRRLIMHAAGSCAHGPNICDWGRSPAVFDGKNATATFTPAFTESPETRVAMVSVHRDGPNLDVMVENTFKNAAGATRNVQAHVTFVPAN